MTFPTRPQQPRRRRRAQNGQPRPYPDGNRWIAPGTVKFPDGSERKIRISGPTQMQASMNLETRRHQLLQEFETSVSNSDKDAYVNSRVEWWLTTVAPVGREYKTLVGYEHAYTAWIRPRLANIRIVDVEVVFLEDFQREVLLTHSPSTWRQIQTVLNHVFRDAIKRRLITHNPMASITCPKSSTPPADHLSLAEARKLVQTAITASERLRLLLALSVGMRQGECLGLRWENVVLDGDQPQIRIREQLQRQTGRGLVLKPPKSKKSIRDIFLTEPALITAFREHRALQNQVRLLAGSAWDSRGTVFTTESGTPVDPKSDRTQWYAALQRAGLRRVKLHSARHTAASLMFGLKIPTYTVSGALGHSSTKVTTDIYGHITDRAVGEAVGVLAAALCVPDREKSAAFEQTAVRSAGILDLEQASR